MPKSKDAKHEADYLDELTEVDSFPTRGGYDQFMGDPSIVRSIVTYSSEEFEHELLNRTIGNLMPGVTAEVFNILVENDLQ